MPEFSAENTAFARRTTMTDTEKFAPEGDQIEIAAEIEKCAGSLHYFATGYAKVPKEPSGVKQYRPKPRHSAELAAIDGERIQLSNWYRQAGYSTLACIYLAWNAVFHPDSSAGILGTNAGCRFLDMKIVQTVIENLPRWMWPGIRRKSKDYIVLNNGAKVVSATVRSGDFGSHPYAPDIIFFDDFGYSPPAAIEEFLAGYLPVYSSSKNKRLIMACVGGASQNAVDMWKKMDDPDVRKSEFYWFEDPSLTPEWAERKKKEIGLTMFGKMYEGTNLR